MRLAPKAKKKIEAKIKQMTDRKTPHAELRWPEELKSLIVGWVQYYRLADMRGYMRKLDQHLRRRIRMNFWKRWKKIKTKYRNLRVLGLSEENATKYANSRKGYWRIAGSEVLNVTLSNKVLREKFGFYTFEGYYDRIMSIN